MPLFSSKNKQDKVTTDNPSRLHKSGHGNVDTYGSGTNNTTTGTGTNTFNPLPTSGAGGGGGIGYNQGPVGPGGPGIAGAHEPYGAGGPTSQGYGGGMTGPMHHGGGAGPGQNQWFGSGEEFSSNNATYGSGGGPAIPPSNVVNHGTSGTGPTHGTTERLTGKVESAMGSLLGSSALKAKGLQKEQEFNSVKLQSSELAEAEKLEREAMMRRERAVAHGAHPANATLGAGHLDRSAGQGGL